MKAITKDLPARFFDYQPGDGTRYTVMYCRTGVSYAYVAIGAGDLTRFGYVVPLSNLMDDIREAAADISKLMEMGLDDPAVPITNREFAEMSIVAYWLGHCPSWDPDNQSERWTATVGLLFAAVLAFGNPNDPAHASLPGSVYRGDWETVLRVIGELDAS